MRSIQQEAMRVLRSADSIGMSYTAIAKRYGIGGHDGANVGFYLRNPITISAAIQVLRMEASGEPNPDPIERKGAALDWDMW